MTRGQSSVQTSREVIYYYVMLLYMYIIISLFKRKSKKNEKQTTIQIKRIKIIKKHQRKQRLYYRMLYDII